MSTQTATVNKTEKRVNVRYLTVTAMLSAVAYILMFLDFSVPFMPAFIKWCRCMFDQKRTALIHHNDRRRRRVIKLYFRRSLCASGRTHLQTQKEPQICTGRLSGRCGIHGNLQYYFKLLSRISGILQLYAGGSDFGSLSGNSSICKKYFTVSDLL